MVEDLIRCKLLFVLLPLGLDAVAWFRAVAGFLLSELVRIVLFGSLLRIEVSEPLRKLFE
jgi:hypothetical protein